MILLNGATVILSPAQALILTTLPLIAAFLLLRRLFELVDNLEKDMANKAKYKKHTRSKNINKVLPLFFLCLFIGLVTIDSGLMYSVINPGFAHLEAISLWYWAFPYIASLMILRNLPKRIDRTIFLFIAISMIGIAFLGFMLLDKTTYAFFLVNTLMMGAFGIFDLFWWSILGEMLDEWENKARIFGIGLAANVLGIIIGQSLALVISRPEIVALLVVFVGLVLLPIMNQQLTKQHRPYAFLSKDVPDDKEGEGKNGSKILLNELLTLLSRREQEILPYLLEGNTNKMIAIKLSLSENTVKTHIKNIYGKLEVRSRNELLHLVLDKSRN
ncbi:MAG: LuxR family transcriptional regulator [Anaerovoracaceae bacterium]|jgi:DNA-binding CsgD family transcriptional regulator|nr:LuxR family transcriptional regulator [Anaerovoracaceae bacterium]